MFIYYEYLISLVGLVYLYKTISTSFDVGNYYVNINMTSQLTKLTNLASPSAPSYRAAEGFGSSAELSILYILNIIHSTILSFIARSKDVLYKILILILSYNNALRPRNDVI